MRTLAFTSALRMRSDKPHIYLHGGYWHVSYSPLEYKGSTSYQPWNRAHTFASKLNTRRIFQ